MSKPKDPVRLLVDALKRSVLTLDQVSEILSCTPSEAAVKLKELEAGGHNVLAVGGTYSIERKPSLGSRSTYVYYSRPDNTYVFGACGDAHLGSKYERVDCLNELYDLYASEGVDRVFNTGNWIEGEASFNKHDVSIRGMDAQLAHLVRFYPCRKGLVTYAVSGDDHEGWYGQREGVDIGKRAEAEFRDGGRDDWVNLGFMESAVRLVNSNTGKEAVLSVIHPGGGSAYALSYTSQKIIESYSEAERPDVQLQGHYHKLWSGMILGSWVVQTGTTQDQTPFMRKKRLQAHVGGAIVTAHQDPKSGRIYRFKPELISLGVKGVVNGRWSHSGKVNLPPRGMRT